MIEISKDEEVIICQKAINTFGQSIQLVVAMEECSELIIALEKFKEGRKSNVEEEIADVEIICNQLSIMYNSELIEEFDRNTMAIDPKVIISEVIITLGRLIQMISKSIRSDKECPVEYYISMIKFGCKVLRTKFNKEEVDKIKQEKLKRLRDLVW